MSNFMKLLGLTFLFFATACSTIEKPFFWKLEKEGRTSYFLGTVHYGVPYRNLPSFVTDKIYSSNAVYLEMDLLPLEDKDGNEIENEGALKEAYNALIFKKPGEPDLSEILSPSAYQYVKKISLKKYSKIFDQLSPYGAGELLNEEDEEAKIYITRYEAEQRNTVWGIDSNIAEVAKGEQKVLGVLDQEPYWNNPEFRKCFFKPIVESLEGYTRNHNKKYRNLAYFNSLVDAYKAGDEKKVIQLHASENSEIELSSDNKCLLDDRNKNWVPIIEKAHQTYAPVFFAAGVYHTLIGPDNILNLLRARGFSIERVEKPQ